jgi:hypothetical protein
MISEEFIEFAPNTSKEKPKDLNVKHWLDLETLGSQPIMSKTFPGIGVKLTPLIHSGLVSTTIFLSLHVTSRDRDS